MKKDILIILIGIMTFLSGCSGQQNITYTYEEPIISPSGKYQIEILNGYNGIIHYKRFNIASLENKSDPEIIYCSTDTFRNRDRTYFVWEDNKDIVWVYSGDVGAFYWELNDQGEWIKYEQGDKEYPMSLKSLMTHKGRE